MILSLRDDIDVVKPLCKDIIINCGPPSFSLSVSLSPSSCVDVRHVDASQYGMMLETSHELEVNSVHQSVLCSHFGLTCLTAFNSLCVQKLCVVTAIRHTRTHIHSTGFFFPHVHIRQHHHLRHHLFTLLPM